MNIPKIISKNRHEYIFVEQCNAKLFRYKEMLNGYSECFTVYDLELIKKQKGIGRGRPKKYE